MVLQNFDCDSITSGRKFGLSTYSFNFFAVASGTLSRSSSIAIFRKFASEASVFADPQSDLMLQNGTFQIVKIFHALTCNPTKGKLVPSAASIMTVAYLSILRLSIRSVQSTLKLCRKLQLQECTRPIHVVFQWKLF